MDSGNYGPSSYNSTGYGREKDFQKVAHTIGTNIQKISQNVSSMKKMVSQLGTPQDSANSRQKLHQIQHYTQQLVKDTSENIKELADIPIPPLEQRQCKMQKDRLFDEFTTVLNAFRETQKKTLQKESEELKRGRADSVSIKIPGPPSNDDPFRESRHSNLIELRDSNSERMQAQRQLEIDEEELRMQIEQEKAIRQLEGEISDANQIFKELAVLVHSQGEIVDSIEAHVENTGINVQQGANHLREASRLSNKLRRQKCLCYSIIGTFTFVMILVFILWSRD